MKAMLLIDMPKWCDNCPCFDGMEERSCCNILKKEVEGLDGIDKDCPLKPIGNFHKLRIEDDEVTNEYLTGWNDCHRVIEILLGLCNEDEEQ